MLKGPFLEALSDLLLIYLRNSFVKFRFNIFFSCMRCMSYAFSKKKKNQMYVLKFVITIKSLVSVVSNVILTNRYEKRFLDSAPCRVGACFLPLHQTPGVVVVVVVRT